MISQFHDLSSVMDRLYGAAIVRFAHGLLVVSAPTSTYTHDGWDPAMESIHAGPDSLYISVQQAASGPVGVVCVEGPYSPEALDLLYSGEISLPDASLAIYDPNGALNLRLPVTGKKNKIEVYGDDPDESAYMWIVITEIS